MQLVSRSTRAARPVTLSSPFQGASHGLRLGFGPVKGKLNIIQQPSRSTGSLQRTRSQGDDKDAAVVSAKVRLDGLLSGIGDGEEEMVQNMLEEEAPDFKIRVNLMIGALITSAAFGICWFCDSDFLGGASLSWSSAQAAVVGLAAAVPLVAAKKWTWSKQAATSFPVVGEMHRLQCEANAPWLSGLTSSQLGLILFAEVLPMIFLLLPAAQGGLEASLTLYGQLLTDTAGISVDNTLVQGVALAVTAALAAMAGAAELSVDEQQYNVVRSAVDNADRYYRVMAMDATTRPQDAARASQAFKSVAANWLSRRLEVSRLAAISSLTYVFYLGGLWHLTGDLTAPAVAGLLGAAVDYHHMHSAVLRGRNTAGNRVI